MWYNHQHTRKLGTQKASYRPEIFPTLLYSNLHFFSQMQLLPVCLSFVCFGFSFNLFPYSFSRWGSAVLPGVSGLPSSLIAVRVPGFQIPCFWPAFVLCFVESSVYFLSPVSSICVQILPAHTAVRDGVAVCERWIRFLLFPNKNSSQVKLNFAVSSWIVVRSLKESDDAAEEFFKTGKLCFKLTTTALFHHTGEKTSHDIFELFSQVDSHRGIYVPVSKHARSR